MGRLLLSSASLVALLSGGFTLPALVAAAPPEKPREAFDSATGRNLLNYPPHVLADVRHMRLTLRIPNMNDRTILANETLTVAPIAHDLSTVTLNSALLQISSVTAPNHTCTFTKNDAEETLDVHLDPPISKGQSADITISYRIVDPPEGLTWTVESPAFPGRAAQVYSQGESESNRYWFVCHDSPNARATSELIVTVPRGYQVVSNGRLESTVQEKLEPFDTFHWVQDKPHAAYLVTLVVGKFDIVDVGTSKLPMPVYVPPGRGSDVRQTFGKTPKMVDFLARVTDQPYPWAKYAQVSVNNFAWGGMENTSATTLYESATLDKTALLDGERGDLVVHELGHQWFGDLLTCKSWEHIWLNEGFATYVEGLWAQYEDAALPSTGRGVEGLKANDAAYDAVVWGWLKDVIKNDTGEAPYQPAMASKEYDSPDDTFDRDANPYPKGALVLHMLRRRLGDDVFFRGLADYVRTNKFTAVESFQFREAMEKAGGVSLQRFFDQWVFRPGVPKIKVSPAWDAAAGMLTVNLEQTQTIDGYNPAFDLGIPVWVRCAGESNWRKLDTRMEERKATATLPLSVRPEMIIVDPEFTNLAKYEVALTGAEWMAQAKAGPTAASRLRAVQALARSGADDAVATDLLSSIVRDEGVLRDLRIEAAASLKMRGKAGATTLRGLLDAKLADARIRSAVVENAAIAHILASGDDVAALGTRLSHIFDSDPSYGVRAAAVKGLGVLKSKAAMPTILKALDTNSHGDQIRIAAVGALADFDEAEALPIVTKRITLGNSSTLRPAAVDALGNLAHHDSERTFNMLAALLDDREPKTALAAGKALAEIGGTRVKTLFEHRLETLSSRAWKATTRQWLKEADSEKKVEKAQAAVP